MKNPQDSTREHTTLPSTRILLVEDGPTNRKVISLMLTGAGADVTTAENGQIGVDLAMKEAFDVILMDMQMPVMDGYAASRALRDAGLSMPIIALTAHAMKGDDEKCRQAGCSGFVAKPVDTDVLIRTVAESLPAEQRTPSHASADSKQKAADGPAVVSSLPTEIDEIREIVLEFVELLHEDLAHMRRAHSNQDGAELARLAHSLKGTGGTAGFDVLTQPAVRLEKAAKTSQWDEIEAALQELSDLSCRIVVQSESVQQ